MLCDIIIFGAGIACGYVLTKSGHADVFLKKMYVYISNIEKHAKK